MREFAGVRVLRPNQANSLIIFKNLKIHIPVAIQGILEKGNHPHRASGCPFMIGY